MPCDLMILDPQSTQDRTVIIIQKGGDYTTEDGKEA